MRYMFLIYSKERSEPPAPQEAETLMGQHFALMQETKQKGILLGVDALKPGEPIFPEDLESAEERAGVRVREGDALLVRSGRWRWRDEHGPWEASTLAAGLDAACLPWLHERAVAALGSDGVSDVLPSRVDGVVMPIHMVCIPIMGLHLLDNLDLEALAGACTEEQRWAFLFLVAPLVLRRGTASPVNPIAVF